MSYNIANSNFLASLTGQVRVLGSASGIDGKTTAVTNLYTVPTGRTCFITGCLVHMTNASVVVGVGVCGVRRSSDSNTMITGVTMTGLDTTGEYFWMTPATSSSAANLGFIAGAGDVVQFNLFSAFTATTATLTIYAIGFEV